MAVAGVGGVSLSQLAQLYRQQLGSTADAAGAAPAGTGPAGIQAAGTAQARAAQTRSTDFANAVGDSLNQLQNLDQTAATKATQAATGDLSDVSDYMIAATQAQTATQLTTTVRNKALDAFNEIMRMTL